MTDTPCYMNIEASQRQVSTFAARVLRRLRAMGAHTAQFEDIEQELWVAWCIACELYDEEKGVPFPAYLMRGMKVHINRYVEKNYSRFHAQTVALSLDASVDPDAADVKLSDVVPDESIETPFELIQRQQQIDVMCKSLTPRAAAFVRILQDPPQEILEEVKKFKSKAEHARSLGISFNQPSGVTASLILDLMGAARYERTKIYKEINMYLHRSEK